MLDRKARAIANERERIKMRAQAVRDQRVVAIRAVEESTSIRRLLGQLGDLAKKPDVDRVSLIRNAT